MVHTKKKKKKKQENEYIKLEGRGLESFSSLCQERDQIQTQVYLAYMLSTVLNLLYWPWARFWTFVKCGAGRSNYQEEIVLFWCSMLIRLKFLQMKPLPVSPKILILIVTLCVLLTKPFAFCCANYLLAPAFLFTNPRHISSLLFHLTVLNLMIS